MPELTRILPLQDDASIQALAEGALASVAACATGRAAPVRRIWSRTHG